MSPCVREHHPPSYQFSLRTNHGHHFASTPMLDPRPLQQATPASSSSHSTHPTPVHPVQSNPSCIQHKPQPSPPTHIKHTSNTSLPPYQAPNPRQPARIPHPTGWRFLLVIMHIAHSATYLELVWLLRRIGRLGYRFPADWRKRKEGIGVAPRTGYLRQALVLPKVVRRGLLLGELLLVVSCGRPSV